ncbi:hypothetical protein PINS_up004871 [Pythium insidiosum]|nr:hypothetical protein PINS_up004871 [Pythium insidiosum]
MATATTTCIRLCCLVVGSPNLLHVDIGGEQATVSILHKRLLDRLSDTGTRSLELYVACVRRPDGQQWMMETDAATPYLCGAQAPHEDAVVHELLEQLDGMQPLEWLAHYVPAQPPLLIDGSLVVHIVAVPDPPIALSAPTSVRPVARWVHALSRAIVQSVPHQLVKTRTPRRFTVLYPSAPGDSLWLAADADPLAVLVRSCWKHELSRVRDWLAPRSTTNEQRVVVIDGAAGVGKSAFVAFLLCVLLRPQRGSLVDDDEGDESTAPWPRRVVLDVPGVTFACIDVRAKEVVEGERRSDFRDVMRRQRTWYVCDCQSASDSRLQEDALRVLVIRSSTRPLPCVDRPRDGRMIIVMPLWTLEELRVAHALHVPPSRRSLDAMEQLFLKWGGLPRRVLVRDAAASEQELERQLAGVTRERVKAMLRWMLRFKWVPGEWTLDMPDLVVRTTSTGANRAASSDDVHVRFCSQFVCDRVIQCVDVTVAQLLELENDALPLCWRQIRLSAMYLAQEEDEKNESCRVDL